MDTADPVLAKVRRSLGRPSGFAGTPVPPAIDEPVTRLVHSGAGLADLFAKRAAALKMLVDTVSSDELMARVAGFLHEKQCRRIMLSDTPLLKRLGAVESLRRAGFDANGWSDLTLDASYDYDAGVTDVDFAVAETGSLVIRHGPAHGRLLSLVPFVHVAVIEPKSFLPDLIDLFELLAKEGCGSGVTMISGPSKTADIEMNVVTGVHGPNIVKAFILQ